MEMLFRLFDCHSTIICPLLITYLIIYLNHYLVHHECQHYNLQHRKCQHHNMKHDIEDTSCAGDFSLFVDYYYTDVIGQVSLL